MGLAIAEGDQRPLTSGANRSPSRGLPQGLDGHYGGMSAATVPKVKCRGLDSNQQFQEPSGFRAIFPLLAQTPQCPAF